jgi:IS605 OrfB family transposase
MKQELTAKLKLTATREQFALLRQTQLAYRDGLNFVSAYSFAHGKTSNTLRLQKETYSELRGQFGLPSQMACNVPRQVGGTYKGLWTKWRKNQEARARGYTKKRFKGLDKPPHYVSPTLIYNYGRDYSLRTGQEVSLLTLQGRLHLPYQGYRKHLALLQQGADIGAAKLWYDQTNKRFYLLVSLEVEVPDPTPASVGQVVGIDVGQRYLATVTTSSNHSQFYSGKEIRAKTDHVARLQKRLRQKGTRSATRTRMRLSRRERRLKLNTNHTISKQILDFHPQAFVGLEDLAGIRERTKRRKKRRKGKKLVLVSPKERKANHHASKWAFAELQSFISYKATLVGSLVMKIDADYTSQMCPCCGFTSPKNRPQKGLLFVCQNPLCHFTLHADLVGARNICLRTLLIRQDWMRTGQLSVAPDVSDREAKVARLSRYAELRWSLDTSSSPLGD